ncbi:MAG: GlsB/YeaQ/YmgE family stress response membrane protein, partial [Bacteroidetes bacterium QH_10_64_19]
MGILTWLVVGAISGWLADMLVGGSSVGLLGDILLGIVGA